MNLYPRPPHISTHVNAVPQTPAPPVNTGGLMGSIRSAVSFIGNSISGGLRQVANSMRTSLRAQSPPVLSFDSAEDEEMETLSTVPIL